jgi:prepilin-type N-terminal cleavage/methylation domain-containing protein
MRGPRQGGFTLVELVVAITVASVVLAFAATFLVAPINAYETEARRAAVVDEAAASWPVIEADLRRALPNSLRARRNGPFVAMELLRVVDFSRYMSKPLVSPFNVAGVFRGVAVPFDRNDHYLSVNNCGPPLCPDAYSLAGSMTPALTRIQIANGAADEQSVTVTPAPAFVADSPRRTMYLVSGPVTYLCDETRGTLRRYENYPVAAAQTSWDSPGEFTLAGFNGELMATGLTSCDFNAAPFSDTVPQTASVRMTATRNTGESITMFNNSGSGWLP